MNVKVQKRMAIYMVALVMLVGLFPIKAVAATKELSVRRVVQAKSNWCWAACAEIAGRYFYNTTRDQDIWTTAIQEKGSWQITGYMEITEATVGTDMINKSVVQKDMDGRLKDVIDVKFIGAPMYHTSFVYLQTKDIEYLVPYGSRPDFTGLKNGNIYNAKDAINILKENMGDMGNVDEKFNGENGGISNGQNNNKPNLIIVISIVCGSSAVLLAIYLIALKKRRKSVTN